MPQEMLRMCNKGLFAGVGLAGQANLALNAISEKPLHALFLRYFKIVYIHMIGPTRSMFKQAWKSGYNACLKICNNFPLLLLIFQKSQPLRQSLDWFVRGSGGFPEAVYYYGGPGPFSLKTFFKFEALVKFVVTALVFRAQIKKSATLYGDPPYWCLNIFTRIRKSIISM